MPGAEQSASATPATPRPKAARPWSKWRRRLHGGHQVTVAHPHLHSGEPARAVRAASCMRRASQASYCASRAWRRSAPRSTNVSDCAAICAARFLPRPRPRASGPRNTMRPPPAWWGCSNTARACRSTASRNCRTAWNPACRPRPNGTWCKAAAKTLGPAHEELINQAAQATVLYNDDTTMKVLQLTRTQRAAALGRRRGRRAHRHLHLRHRRDRMPAIRSRCSSPACATPGRILPPCSPAASPDLPAPIQMCDGSRAMSRATSTRPRLSASPMPGESMWN